MNINIMNQAKAISDHADILRGAGIEIPHTAVPILLPDEDVEGVFQVWWPTIHGQFVYITASGQTVRVDNLPDAEMFIAPGESSN